MAPRKQKTKANSQAAIDQHDSTSASPPRQEQPPPAPQSPESPHVAKLKGTFDHSKTTPKTPSDKVDADTPPLESQRRSSRASWYKGGSSWRAKASPVAQATRESISVAGGATSEALAEGASQVGRYMHNSLKRSSKSIPSLPSESHIYATGSNTELDKPNTAKDTIVAQDTKPANTTEPAVVEESDENKHGHVAKDAEMKQQPPLEESALEQAPLPPTPTKDAASQSGSSQQTVAPQKGWWGWWPRPDGYTAEQEKADAAAAATAAEEVVEASTTPLPDNTTTPSPDTCATVNDDTTSIPIATDAKPANGPPSKEPDYGSTRSWFGLWSRAQNTQAHPEEPSTQPQQSPPENTAPPEAPAIEQAQRPQGSVGPDSGERVLGEDSPRSKSAGWAFWSRERTGGDSPTPNGTQRQIGELAVADTPSQSHPEAAQFNQERDQKSNARSKQKPTALKESKLNRVTTNADTAPTTPTHSPPQTRSTTPEPAKALDTSKTTKPQAQALAQAQLQTQTRPPNMVMPSFHETYSTASVPTYWDRVTSYVASSLRLIDTPVPSPHVSITPTLPRVKNTVAIGVHGYFPAPLIQKVLGPPTGTSIRFANHASAAVRAWAEKNQPDTPCEIETVALEGEGFIADRVNTLWKLLLNWLSHLRQADLIFVACHSQGVPVAVMLVSKLIQLGCLSPHAKIGICAMAGVNLGPFADYKSRFLGAGAAAELFEFSRPGSKVSIEYAAALDVVLRHNVRITYVGSIDDQLVSLESSTFSTLSHPYVYRATFIDGRIHAPDFITHLVAFALKLRNLGISDHGLIRELSLPLAGSLYGGQGHSTVYDENAVYDLALEFCLETTDVVPRVSVGRGPGSDGEAQARRSSRAGPPYSVTAANALRRGSVSAHTITGIPPALAPFEMPASGSNSNPYFLPWALRGILEEDVVRNDFSAEVKELAGRFEEWKPVSKVLKDVRFRLEGVRSKL